MILFVNAFTEYSFVVIVTFVNERNSSNFYPTLLTIITTNLDLQVMATRCLYFTCVLTKEVLEKLTEPELELEWNLLFCNLWNERG